MATRNKTILDCRLCNKKNLKNIFDFGLMPLGNNLKSHKINSLKIEKYPLSINQCLDCKHFQLNFSVDPDLLYATNYTYLTGVGESFRKHLELFSKDVLKYIPNEKENYKTRVIDIGSNDGTALSYFIKNGCEVLGIDPAKIPSDIANKNGIDTINNFFSLNLAEQIVKENQLFDIVISHNVLAHIEDINGVFEGIHKVLKINGLLVFEVGYFGDIISKNIYDTIYHEHLDYHSKKPLSEFLIKKGFSVKKIETNTVQGGSVRFFCIKEYRARIYSNVMKQLSVEKKIFQYKKINIWVDNIFKNIDSIKADISKASAKGVHVWGYGAPTKATLITNMLGEIAGSIEFIIDDNPLKENKYIPGTFIPIIKKSQMPIFKNQLIICFAWNFFDDIYSKLKLQNIQGILLNIQDGKKEKL
jgi:2-polyprenyl-3-methyl-5-hydroxy-6-metoxy-1,4-benzoquinol methylase